MEFLFAAGPAEPLRPLSAVASGGESARIMLALKAAPSLLPPAAPDSGQGEADADAEDEGEGNAGADGGCGAAGPAAPPRLPAALSCGRQLHSSGARLGAGTL